MRKNIELKIAAFFIAAAILCGAAAALQTDQIVPVIYLEPSAVSISTDRQAYFLGENVYISFSSLKPDNELVLSTATEEYRYLGAAESPIAFVPPKTGSYSASIMENGNAIATASFEVVEANQLINAAGMPSLKPRKNDFKTGEQAEFDFEFSAQGNATGLGKSIGRWESAGETISASVRDSLGALADLPVEITKQGEGKFQLSIQSRRAFKAGKYTLSLQLLKDGKTYIQQQDFTWGVLAINTNKSIFLPNEDAFIAMGVLDDFGHMVCDANLSLTVTAPDGTANTLTTDNGEISVSKECMIYGATELPDYYATYRVGKAGTYALNLTAITANGVRSIVDSFSVEDSVEYDVARYAPTRIYPILDYTMSFTINANGGYSGAVKEYVPSGFYISPQEGMTVAIAGDTKVLSWSRDFKAGETYTLSYKFNAPDTSPEFYLLGPLAIGNWSEARSWQIASDVFAAGEREVTFLRARGCRLESSTTTAQTFSSACAGVYTTGNCAAAGDRLSCNDANVESVAPANNRWGGVNITSFNSTITDCESITSVRLCHNWTTTTVSTYANCRVGTDTAGDRTYATTAVACPTTTSNALVCTDVTGSEASWSCQRFFDITAPATWAMIEAQRTQSGAGHTLRFNVFYFNVTYVQDTTKPNTTIIVPLRGNFSGSFLVNASINDTKTVRSGNLTLLRPGVVAIPLQPMSLSAGTTTAGYWNDTIDTIALGIADGYYNISVNGTDRSGNSNISENVSIIIDNTKPNATAIVPLNNTNISSNFLINASVNDSLSQVFNATFRLINPSASTAWLFATRGSGSISVGWWNTTVVVSGIADGAYNITINATDFSGNQNLVNISQIVVDQSGPNATIVVPVNSTNVTNSVLINASVNDSASKVFNATFRFISPSFTGAWLYATRGSGTISVGWWNVTTSVSGLTEGRYNITANVTDFGGNQRLVNISEITVDRTGPNATTVVPVNNSNVGGNLLVNASVNDSVSGVFNCSFRLINENANSGWIYATMGAGTIAVGWWNITFNTATIQDGRYNITINATDFANNQVLINISEVNLDSGKPNATIVVPLNGTNLTANFLINASVNDSVSMVFNATFRLARPSYATDWIFATRGAGTVSVGWWNTTAVVSGLEDYIYNITVNATDFAGNQQLLNISQIVIDQSGPNATIVVPVNGTNVSNTLLINASVNDSASQVVNATFRLISPSYLGAWLYATMGSGTIAVGWWNVTTSVSALADGRYNITANVTDFGGNQRLVNISEIVVDRTGPNATIVVPLNGSNLSNTILINASVNDSLSGVFNATFRLINPSASTTWIFATMGAGSISAGWWNATFDTTALVDGIYNITINATDFSGNQRIVNISEMLVENTKPNATAISPLNGTYLNASFLINSSMNSSSGIANASFRFSNNDMTGTWVYATLGAGTIKIGYWNITFDSTSLINGTYNITANATSFSGVQAIINISTVNIENNAPNISFIPNTEADLTYFARDYVLLNVTVNASFERNVTFSISNSTWQNTTTVLAGVRLINFTGLADSPYTYNATIVDMVNLSSITENRNITLDNVKPVISLVSPPNNTREIYNSLISFEFAASDANIISNCSLVINRQMVSNITSVDMVSTNTIPYSLANGVYNWSINCTDAAGNSNGSLMRNITLAVQVPQRLYYEYNATVGSGSGTTEQGINLSLTADPNAHTIALASVPLGAIMTFVNATLLNRSEYGRNGILITASSTISFRGWFDANNAGAGSPIWNITKKNTTGEFGICSVESPTTYVKNNPTPISATCTSPSANYRIAPDENLTLQVKTKALQNGRTHRHYYGNTYDSYVSFNAYKLGDLQMNLTYFVKNISVNETTLFNASCNISCEDEHCLNTNAFIQINTSADTWMDINGTSGNIILDSGQLNPVPLGITNSSLQQLNFSLIANSPSTSKIRCVATSDYSNVNGTLNSTVEINETTDLAIAASEIAMLNITLASENNNITINATVWNNGTGAAASFIVGFFEVSTGVEILLSNKTVNSLASGEYAIVNTTYLVKAGFNNITIRVNSNRSINEFNFSNNEANLSFYVSSYSFFYGNFTRMYEIGNYSTFISWTPENSTGNVYVADADSTVDFTALQAFGRTIAGGAASSDFTEADSLLGLAGLTDSLANIYTTDGNTPKETTTFTAYGEPIITVPVANSIGSPSFKTGIFWDTSKDSGDGEYDALDSEPLIFVVEVTLPKQGTYVFCSYEIRVPAKLRSYQQPNNQNSISFYKEIV
ncbi:MAG: Ig-like domain-containing protein [Candidatus Woesearchaeota archaeon]